MMNYTPIQILNSLAQILYDKKAMNILALDVKGFSSMTDYLLIAEGNVDRHVLSLAHGVVEKMKKMGIRLLHQEGLSSGEWVVLDFNEVMVHLFMPGLREKYALEKMWKEAQIVDLEITIDSDQETTSL